MNEARAWGLGVLRGGSQIYFQNNVITAAAIFGAFFVADWRMGALALIGAVGGVAGGRLSGYRLDNLAQGLQGFCGALVGAAVFAAGLVSLEMAAVGLALLGGLATGPVTRAIDALFGTAPIRRFGLPATTAPFALVASAIVMLVPTAPALPSSSELTATFVAESAPAMMLVRSLLTNVSQVILVNNAWAGALILVGLFAAGWRVGLVALAGSAMGTATALALGKPLEFIGDGMVGYSGVLTALALAVVFLKPGWWASLYAVPWVVVTAVVTVLMQSLPIPTYTWPYILTTWVALVVAHVVRLNR